MCTQNENGRKSISNKEFDLTETANIFLWFGLISPFVGIFANKILNISFEGLGEYGDVLGGSTLPFLTFASILYIAKTIKIQQNQLKIQKDEFGLVREELEEAKTALQQQSKTANLSRFENTFYLLMNELRLDIQNFHFSNDTKRFSGYGYLTYLIEEFNSQIKKQTSSCWYKEERQKLRATHIDEDYYRLHGQTIEKALISLERGTEYYVFIDHLSQVFQLLRRNKSLLEEWDINFYLNYLFSITRLEAKYLFLFDSTVMFNIENIESIKDLNLLNYTHEHFTKNVSDYKFAKYVVDNNFDILPELKGLL